MSEFKIRKCENLFLLSQLDLEIFPKENDLDFSECLNWCVYRDKQPVGFCSLKILDSEIVYFTKCGLIPSARGNGLQKRLIKVRTRYAKKINKRHCITYTIKENPHSYNNLQSCGFKLYEPEYKYVGDHVLYWRKDL